MGDKSDDAADVRAPRLGLVTVTSITGGTASDAIAHGGAPGQFVSVGIDNGSTSAASMPIWWVVYGDSGVTAPNPTDTAPAGGDGRCFGPYQGIAHHKVAAGSVETHYRVLASGSGTFYVRHYVSSQGG